MSERALSFGAVAAAYDRYRLGYPDEITDLVLAYARPPVERALEVGAGTGKATGLFAGRGIRVTACEPDEQMASVLRERTSALPVDVVVSTFEALPGDLAPYDLVFAGAAWHWTDGSTRWARTAELLRRGGTFASFASGGAGSTLADPALREAVSAVRRGVMPDEQRLTEERGPSGTWWPGSELEREAAFADVEEHDVERLVERSREDYLGALGTMSSFLLLGPAVREGVLEQIGRILPPTVAVDAGLRLHLARRV